MIITRKLTITGRVQGVGYRSWTCGQARMLGLDGWVRNRMDGSVEALVQGEEAAIKELIARCQVGPLAARVEKVIAEEAGETVEKGFQQIATL